MGRSFGLIAASVAAGLALLIGVIAYTTHHQDNSKPPGGAQGLSPAVIGSAARNMAGPPSEINASPVGPPVTASTPRGNTSGGFGGGAGNQTQVTTGGAGGSAGQAAAVVTRSCTPGVLQSLVGALSSLLGGGGATC